MRFQNQISYPYKVSMSDQYPEPQYIPCWFRNTQSFNFPPTSFRALVSFLHFFSLTSILFSCISTFLRRYSSLLAADESFSSRLLKTNLFFIWLDYLTSQLANSPYCIWISSDSVCSLCFIQILLAGMIFLWKYSTLIVLISKFTTSNFSFSECYILIRNIRKIIEQVIMRVSGVT